jgi:tripartite-type tricarboxylate transporter receptor subunit TctC
MKQMTGIAFNRRSAAWALALVAGALGQLPAHAQSPAQPAYPNKPIRMIVPLAAGSAVDVAARLLAQKMGANMGQTIVVENIVGAAGVIGAQQLAKAAPDGYTIGGFNDSVLTMVPNLNAQTPFNPVTDFVHVSRVATIEFSVAVAPNSPWKSAADLVSAAKAAPDKFTYASGGNGSPQHMGGALFAAHTGIELKHVPYRGASQAAQDVAGNQVDMTFQGIATVASLAKGGKLKLIGVMADQRHPEYPDTPTLKEVGIQGFEYSTWFGMTAPKGTPKEIADRLQREVVKALADPEIQTRYAALGLKSNGSTPEVMMANVREQLQRYGKAIKDNNIKGD